MNKDIEPKTQTNGAGKGGGVRVTIAVAEPEEPKEKKGKKTKALRQQMKIMKRRHHNTKGIRHIKRGKTVNDVKRIARKLRIPYSE